LDGCNTITKKFYIPKTDPRYGKNFTVQVFSDVGTPSPCYYPTLHDEGLEYLYEHYENATWVLFVREAEEWYDSMRRWYNGTLLQQWKNKCGFTGSNVNGGGSKADWINFYNRHTRKIRDFAMNHSRINYIEVELEQAHSTLGQYTGIDDKCWRHCIPGRDDDEKCVEISETRSGKMQSKGPSKKADRLLAQKVLDSNVGKNNTTAVKMDNSPPLPWSLPAVPTTRKNATQFMQELANLKRRQNISLPWEVLKLAAGKLKLPTPIIILNLPKSGTQTLTEYFQCGKVLSTHTYVRTTRTGDCLRDNYLADINSSATGSANARGVHPLHGCNSTIGWILTNSGKVYKNTTVLTYSDIGTPYPGRCFYSSIHDGGLDHLYKYYPNATIMLLTREVESWYSSLSKWNEGRLLNAWRQRCKFSGSIGDGSKEDWIDFYHAHTEKIRNFAKDHLSLTYVEMELETAPSLIEYYTGIKSDCFQHCLPGKKKHEMCRPVGGRNASVSVVGDDLGDSDGNQRKGKAGKGSANEPKEKVIVDNSPPLPWSLPKVPAIRKTSKEFMKELAALKRNRKLTLPWELPTSNSTLKLPTPIFILNLPKSGTQTLAEYFKCGNIESSHTYVRTTRTGDCLRDNYLVDQASNVHGEKNPLRGCNEVTKIYHIPKSHPDYGKNATVMTYSDIGTPYPGRCFYSSVHDGGLEHLYKYYPNATIMLLTREVESWYSSLSKWNEGFLLKRWKNRCGFRGSIGDGSKEDWIDFYHAHTEKIRNFAKDHLSLTYVEMELEDAPSMIEFYTGVKSDCFQHCLPGKKTGEACKPVGTTQVSFR
jgi:uncharacterized protein CbrC (UPF0167 family)